MYSYPNFPTQVKNDELREEIGVKKEADSAPRAEEADAKRAEASVKKFSTPRAKGEERVVYTTPRVNSNEVPTPPTLVPPSPSASVDDRPVPETHEDLTSTTALFTSESKPLDLNWVHSSNVVIESAYRSLSNNSIGDVGRSILGAGTFRMEIQNTSGLRRMRLFVKDKGFVFTSECPNPKDDNLKLIPPIMGNAGEDPAFHWDTDNEDHEKGGTRIKGAADGEKSVAHRRFVFVLANNVDLELVLKFMFYNDLNKVNEFFTARSRYYLRKAEGIPLPHKVIKPTEDEMEIDVPVDMPMKSGKPQRSVEQMREKYGYDTSSSSQTY